MPGNENATKCEETIKYSDVCTVESTVRHVISNVICKEWTREASCDIWNIYGSNAFQFVLKVQKR